MRGWIFKSESEASEARYLFEVGQPGAYSLSGYIGPTRLESRDEMLLVYRLTDQRMVLATGLWVVIVTDESVEAPNAVELDVSLFAALPLG